MQHDSRQQDPLWYKDAVIYQLHVKTFWDSNKDGMGDFRGLRQKLDYLQDLGVTAVWLLPFYPSPLRDDGYDIADFNNVHSNYGRLRDFKAFLRSAHERGIRVITELVINHTSDQHPWFQRARRAGSGSVWRDFYVWSDTPQKYAEARVIFQDYESSNWTWDPVARAYYWHRFYAHQPDLNFENPRVRQAVVKSLDFWLKMGVDGLRLDAVPYLYQREGTNCENLPETHAFLKKLRAHVDERHPGRMFLAEANQWPEDAVAYFGEGDECHMSFHFPLMPRLYMALHMENRYPITDIFEQTPPIPESSQWAIFLRNHDELTLEMVTDEERDYMYRVYAEDPRMRLNLGIRRRLAPLLGNHRRRIEVMNGLLFSLPGTPIIYYGDEIGMGDNIYLGDRNGVRTPMQWSPDRNAGFSLANPQKLYLPVIIDPEYHYEVVNVESQAGNRHSLMWWMRRLITLRSRIKAFSRGCLQLLYPENSHILAYLRIFKAQCILVVVNLSRYAQFVELDLADHVGKVPVEIFGNTPFPVIDAAPYRLTLGPHSFFWFILRPEHELYTPRDGSAETENAPPPVFTFQRRWETLFDGRLPVRLSQRLQTYIQGRRWFAAKSHRIKSVSIREAIPLRGHSIEALLVLLDVATLDGADTCYILPLALATDARAEELVQKAPRAVLARARNRSGTKEGLLVDAFYLPAFGCLLFEMMSRRGAARGKSGKMTAAPVGGRKTLRAETIGCDEVSLLKAEQSNTSVVFADRFILKMFRQLQPGVNPDLEISRFLMRRGFKHLPRVAGILEYDRTDAAPATLAVLQTYVSNQGDAWEYTVNQLCHYFESLLETKGKVAAPARPATSPARLAQQTIPPEVVDRLDVYLESVRLLAERSAQLHTVLASESRDPAFTPERFTRLYQRSLYQSMRSLAGRVFTRLKARAAELPPAAKTAADRILARRDEVLGRFAALTGEKINAWRIRCHGDYHLGQVLYTGRDFVIIDFEGEPARPVSERRIKRCPLYDVAGMLRSFHYAAHYALHNETLRGVFHAEDIPVMKTWADDWYQWIGVAFLQHYQAGAAEGGFLPAGGREFELLLDTMLMEKAVYEIGYELDSRPEWIRIPIEGLEQLLTTAAPAGRQD